MQGDVAVGVGRVGGASTGSAGGVATPPPTANATEPADAPAEEREDDEEGGELPPTDTKRSPMEDDGQHLSVLDASVDGGLAVLSEVPIADWASLQSAAAGKALFSVGNGLLVVDLAHPAQPEAQAFFPTRGWPSRIHVDSAGGQAYVPAGRYGVYRFDLDVRNLLVLE